MPIFPTDIKLTLPVDESIEFNVIKTEKYAGNVKTKLLNSFEQRTLKLKFDILSPEKVDILWTFYKDRKGSFEPFAFIHPDTNETLWVRFTSNSMTKTEFSNKLFSTGLEIETTL